MNDDSKDNVVDIKPEVKRDAKGRILPGASLNPAGGNKPTYLRAGKNKYDINELYRDNAGLVFAELLKTIQDPKTPASARISAIKEFNDRAFGRPAQTTIMRKDEDSATGLDLSDASDQFLEELTRLRLAD